VLKNVKNGPDDLGDRDSSFGRLLAGALDARSASVRKDARSASPGEDARSASPGEDARSASLREDARSASLREDARGALMPDEGCLDADTLAAWADDNLGRAERTAAEAHAADCARCQALLAAMVKIAPAPDASKPWWRLSALGWLIPVTAATAGAIVIWAILPGRAPLHRSERTTSVAASSAASGAASGVDRFARADAPLPGPPPVRLEEQNGQREARSVPPDESTRRNARPAAPLGLQGARVDKQKAAPLEERAKKAAAAPPDTSDMKQSFSADATARSQPATVGGVTGIPEPKAEAARSAAPPMSMSEAVTVTTRMRALDAALGTVITSPNPASLWRIVPGGGIPAGAGSGSPSIPGRFGSPGNPGNAGNAGNPGNVVQRSIDGGTTWQTQEIGASLPLTAGASPSPSVCWLVGPAGTVLLSTDGRSWQRLAFPETVNLVSVTATDARIATVTANDGRRFTTTDGGLTWARSGS
jgi:hypothetical protein